MINIQEGRRQGTAEGRRAGGGRRVEARKAHQRSGPNVGACLYNLPRCKGCSSDDEHDYGGDDADHDDDAAAVAHHGF